MTTIITPTLAATGLLLLLGACAAPTGRDVPMAEAMSAAQAVRYRPAQSVSRVLLAGMPAPEAGGTVQRKLTGHSGRVAVLTRTKGVPAATARPLAALACTRRGGQITTAETATLSGGDLGFLVGCAF